MRILLIVHGYPPAAVGGTEVYTHDLATALAADPAASVFVLTREADPNRPDGDVRRETEGRVTVDRVNNTFDRARPSRTPIAIRRFFARRRLSSRRFAPTSPTSTT